MQVAKWGNSLAIRIPATVAEALDLKAGDEISVRVSESRTFEIARDDSRAQALERIRAAKIRLPAGWKFDREVANERGE
ncbi:AbrB/MazE/SpoVT family DNA-binding domain-containing protein [Rhizobium sp. S-51]|uniref:AbrB/MazE/SpoVT family DNA-binding domain-containing protein n=1 Tax=Rhizobium terricola TaxID=2728849 RepID=A0A7Y0AWD5_9HYPH|nr:AbrB/MazE/SpoVT family DNA-binding domain-containing protein [Rhizobium terricola]NML74615.1 AbrB/MazE/SpoVT family DNA-binding domain-containing protein [Rhizobium terricola]